MTDAVPDGAMIRRYCRDLGGRVRAARLKANFNQTELADRIGLTRSSIANLEAGRQRIPVHVLAMAAEVLGVAPVDLLPDCSFSEHTDDFFNLDEPLAAMGEDARAFIAGALAGPEAYDEP